MKPSESYKRNVIDKVVTGDLEFKRHLLEVRKISSGPVSTTYRSPDYVRMADIYLKIVEIEKFDEDFAWTLAEEGGNDL